MVRKQRPGVDRQTVPLSDLPQQLLRRGYHSFVNFVSPGTDTAVSASKPALVLLDLMMPVMDGFEFLRRLRADEAHADLPVVVLTAKIMTDSETRELESATLEVLSKQAADNRTVAEEIHRVLDQEPFQDANDVPP